MMKLSLRSLADACSYISHIYRSIGVLHRYGMWDCIKNSGDYYFETTALFPKLDVGLN
jgi:hypothetical protein